MTMFRANVLCISLAIIVAIPVAHAQAVPAGSYQQTCQDARMQGGRLTGSCRDRGGAFRHTELRDPAQCIGDIFNDDGALTCSRGSRPPAGTYARSCEQAFVDGPNLRANCRNRGGGVAATTLLDFGHCVGDISNDDGVLRCSRGNLPPDGSYADSCRSTFMDGQTLTSVCRTITGAEVPTSLANVGACRSTITNINGRLTCIMGSGPIPPGSYMASCRDIVVTPTTITASCRTIDNANRTSVLANPASCLQPIDNIDGFLACPMGKAAAPPGSYRASCHAIVTNDTLLSASCRRGDGSYQDSALGFAACHGLISNRDGVLTCPTPSPVIAVQSKGDGSFVVTGASFLPSAVVHVRVTEGALGNAVSFNDTASADGKLVGLPTGKICQRHGDLFFSANDGRIADGVAITSNVVTTSCPF
jgi:hypothetical protein